MVFDKFTHQCHEFWHDYLNRIQDAIRAGKIYKTKPEIEILFPNILLVTQCQGFYVMELLGATRTYGGLQRKQHKESNIYKYLSQLDDSAPTPCIRFTGGSGVGNRIRNAFVGQDVDRAELERRFPSINLLQGRVYSPRRLRLPNCI